MHALSNIFSKKAMFVVDPFKGEAYKKLVAENCRIYGSGALISSLALKGTFKIRSFHILLKILKKRWFWTQKVPIKHNAKAFSHGGLISMAMCGLNVCFTNIRSEMRSVLIQKSLQMGADVHTHMSTEVTHLVVGETQSKKYIVGKDSTYSSTFLCRFWSFLHSKLWTFGFESNKSMWKWYNYSHRKVGGRFMGDFGKITSSNSPWQIRRFQKNYRSK